MWNPIPKLRQNFIIFEKTSYCLKNWKLWRAPTTIEFNIFCGNLAHVSNLTMSTKSCSRFLYFCLDLELLIEI